MRRFSILAAAIALLISLSGVALGAWGIGLVGSPDWVAKGNWVAFGVKFQSDASAMSATDIIAKLPDGLKSKVQGGTLYAMIVSPGTGGVAPNAAFDITLTNDWGRTLYAGASIVHTSDSSPDITEDLYVYPPILEKLNVAFSDIGDAGDQVTLYFYVWVESGR